MTPRTADIGDPTPTALDYEGHRIRRRGTMLNLTDMWSAARRPDHRTPADWLALDDTYRFRTRGLDPRDELLFPHDLEAGDAGVWIVARDGLVATRRGPRAETWAHWQLALSYGRYLSPAFLPGATPPSAPSWRGGTTTPWRVPVPCTAPSPGSSPACTGGSMPSSATCATACSSRSPPATSSWANGGTSPCAAAASWSRCCATRPTEGSAPAAAWGC